MKALIVTIAFVFNNAVQQKRTVLLTACYLIKIQFQVTCIPLSHVSYNADSTASLCSQFSNKPPATITAGLLARSTCTYNYYTPETTKKQQKKENPPVTAGFNEGSRGQLAGEVGSTD